MSRTIIVSAVIFVAAIGVQGSDIGHSLTTLTSALAAQFRPESQPAVIAVMPFENTASADDKVGYAIAEHLIELVRADGAYTVVDRLQFEKITQEMALSQTGIMDESGAVTVGKALAARYLLVGTISSALGKAMVTARIIETETGQIQASSRVPVDPAILSRFTAELMGERGTVGAALFRSMVLPGWGQFFCERNLRGAISLAAFLGAAGFTGASGIMTAQKAREYDDFIAVTRTVSGKARLRAEFEALGPTPGDPTDYQDALNEYIRSRKSSYWDAYDAQRGATIIAAAITGGVWTLNLLDAAIAGVQTRRKVELYFGANPVTGNYRVAANFAY